MRLREVAFCQNCAHRLFAEKARAGFDFARGALVSDEGETDADVTEEKVLAIAFSGGLASR